MLWEVGLDIRYHCILYCTHNLIDIYMDVRLVYFNNKIDIL